MRCPIDSTELIVTERQGIGIHTCPSCNGLWLERGELDEIINRSIPGVAVVGLEPQPSRGHTDRLEDVDDRFRDGDKTRRRRDKYSDDFDDRPRKGKKKKGRRDMVEDLLDF